MLLHKLPGEDRGLCCGQGLYIGLTAGMIRMHDSQAQILDRNVWCLTAILNTYSNAGHIGGSRCL